MRCTGVALPVVLCFFALALALSACATQQEERVQPHSVMTPEERAWFVASDEATSNAYRFYLSKHPDTARRAEVERILDQMDWARLSALDTIDGVELLTPIFFNEMTVRLSKPADDVVNALADKGLLAGVPASRLYPGKDLDDLLLIAATETNTDADIDALDSALRAAL